jgi:asparagine synthase (glutamine-hydrolysing)
MCGIFGVANLGPDVLASSGLRDAFARTATRGPDGTGLFLFSGAARLDVTDERRGFELRPKEYLLGHHRLAIVDVVDQANQPMGNEDGTVWVVFNGEIYNTAALRAELVAKGHRFATESSDTEVIVHGWEEWGRELPKKLSGLFAVAILDFKRGELVLLRDFPGTKPLYYRASGELVVFGSTATSVAQLDSSRALDRAAWSHWLATGYTPVDRSMFAGVSKLAPGTGLSVRLADGRADSFSFRPELRFGREPFRRDRFESVFVEVLREQLHADVPVGFFLSGGVDSSLVAAYARELFPDREFDCYSMRFPGAGHDESPYSEMLAKQLRFRRHVVDAPELSLATVSEFVGAMDEPISDPSFFSTWHLSKAIGRSVKVCVGGDGGDELFSGYERYLIATAALARARRWPLLARQVRARFQPLLRAGRLGRKLIAAFGAPAQVNLALETIGLTELAPTESLKEVLAGVDSSVPETIELLLGRMQAHDLSAPLSEDILFKVDRTSMANHFEARVPFLDQRTVRYALSCELGGNLAPGTTKVPLRRLCESLGIAGALNPRKQGFGIDLKAGSARISAALADAGGAARVARLTGRGSVVAHGIRRPMSRWSLLVLELWLAAQGIEEFR